VATDTASYSDQVFGLFALLGYQFSPRLADMPDQKFWRINPDADYGRLNALVPDRKHLLAVTQGGGTPTTLGRALAEYGNPATPWRGASCTAAADSSTSPTGKARKTNSARSGWC
jgi:hypothetical protein